MYYYYNITTGDYCGCGNEATPPVGMTAKTTPPTPIPKTDDEIIQELTSAVQSYLDTKARERNYDGILPLCSYAISSNAQFAKEGQAGAAWRDACWSKCYEVMAAVKTGTATIPTATELIAMLPVFVWP